MSDDNTLQCSSNTSIFRQRRVVKYTESNDDSDDESENFSIKRRRVESDSKYSEIEETTSPPLNGNSDVDLPSKTCNGNSTVICNSSRKLSTDCDEYQQSSGKHHEEKVKSKKKKKRHTISHRRSLCSLGLEEEGSSCEDEDGIGALATSSKRVRSSSRECFPNMLLRRSNRQRKTIYKTLNVSSIEEAAMSPDVEEHTGPSTRQRSTTLRRVKPEVRDLLISQGKRPEDAANFSQPDIYSNIKSRKRSRRPKKFFDETDNSTKDTPQDHAPSEHSNEEQLVEEEKKDEGEEEEEEEDDTDDDDDDTDDDDDDDNDYEENVIKRKYSLRKKRAQPIRLVYEIQSPSRQAPSEIFDRLPASSHHRRRRKRARDLAIQHSTSPYQQRGLRTNSQEGGASSGTTETDEDDDEARFERRKKKSMSKARNRCLPMNLTPNDLTKHGFANERSKIGSSLADVDPMKVDKSVMFSSIGGNQNHVRSLKEMVVFPLMYPEVFQKFHINPPRGCLFYGPPGTGKTLMARALANECSVDGKKVAFFMRKGADCLSKWVGESERQLRLLFDQAYQMRPSIIFFDEIDGLAPVRSSRQDQIHSSIVSTLLGLMDGLDNRGEIIVIGATNRIDSIDPALRRPGRFDREFLFPLPDKKARRDILAIHTQKWSPPPANNLLDDLAEKTAGYCGADIMALCAESALFALRRRYPQIYASSDKLKLDVDKIDIKAQDFFKAMKNVVPTAQRSDVNPSHALQPTIRPLLANTLRNAIIQLAKIFPLVHKKSKILNADDASADLSRLSDSDSDIDDDNQQPLLPLPPNGLNISHPSLIRISSHVYRDSTTHRPRMLLCGHPRDGQTTHLGPALLHDLESLPVHLLDTPTVYGSLSARTPEEACGQIFREARRTAPSIIFIPNASMWWQSANFTVHHTFKSLLKTLPASAPVAIIATADCLRNDLPPGLSSLFREYRKEVFTMRPPTEEERTLFFSPVFLQLTRKPPVNKIKKQIQCLEVLEKAPPLKEIQLTEVELQKIELEEEATMRNLRLFLRDVLTRLAQDRRFKVFLKPVDTEEVTDYTEVIDEPMDISSMMNKIDQHKYHNVASFLSDINLICNNALEYNPDVCAEDKAIRHRACLLRDMAHAIIQGELEPKFEILCNEVTEARRKRNADPLKFAPTQLSTSFKFRRHSQTKKAADSTSQSTRRESFLESISEEPSCASYPRHDDPRRKPKSVWASAATKKNKVRIEDDSDEGSSERDEDAIHDHRSKNTVFFQKKILDEDEETHSTIRDGVIKTNENLDREHRMGPSGDADTKSFLRHCRKDPPVFYEEGQNGNLNNVFMEENNDPTSSTDKNKNLEKMEDSCDESDPSFQETQDNSVDEEERRDGKKESLSRMYSDISSYSNESENENTDKQQHLPLKESDGVIEDQPPSEVAIAYDVIKNLKHRQDFVQEQEKKAELIEAKTEKVIRDPCSPNGHSNEGEVEPVRPPTPPPLIVDEAKLKGLLHYTVQATESFCLEELEELYSVLTRCIYKHRQHYDKTTLLQELSTEVTSFAKFVTEASDFES